MKTTDFARIAALVPANRVAATVTGRSKEHVVTVNLPPGYTSSDVPLPIIPRHELQASPLAILKELQAQKHGRLTVVGVSPKTSLAGANYVVRCDCGRYEHRKRKALVTRNESNGHLRCVVCETAESNKWKYQTLGPRSLAEITGSNAK